MATDMTKITDYQLHRLHIELPLPIGDSQVIFTDHWMTIVELIDEAGRGGVGFEIQQGLPTAGLVQQKAQFEHAVWPTFGGAEPMSQVLKISRPRGGNVGATPMTTAIETALWDLVGKQLDQPLYRLFGGTNPKVRAYGSTLDFHLPDEQFRDRLSDFQRMGFGGIKIKVGHPDIEWDLKRMAMALEVMGADVDLMIDSNEAWSPTVALIRINRYQTEGFRVFWVEDPITREDYDGYRMLCAETGHTRINTGEYLGFHGKRRLLESHGVDVLNVHGHFGQTRSAAHLAGDYGIPVSMGNTILELGVHLGASLPECLYLEFSDLAWNNVAVEPVQFRDSYAIAPDRPGHGIELDREAVAKYSCPE